MGLNQAPGLSRGVSDFFFLTVWMGIKAYEFRADLLKNRWKVNPAQVPMKMGQRLGVASDLQTALERVSTLLVFIATKSKQRIPTAKQIQATSAFLGIKSKSDMIV